MLGFADAEAQRRQMCWRRDVLEECTQFFERIGLKSIEEWIHGLDKTMKPVDRQK